MTSAPEPTRNATPLWRRFRIGDDLARAGDDRTWRQRAPRAIADASPHASTIKDWGTSRGSHPRSFWRADDAPVVSAAKSP